MPACHLDFKSSHSSPKDNIAAFAVDSFSNSTTIRFLAMGSINGWDISAREKSSNISRYSLLERLPNELLHKILQHIITRAPGRCWFTPHKIPGESSATSCLPSLKPFLLTSRTLSASAIFLMYREPKIKHGSTATSAISRFFATLGRDHQLRNLVRSLDLVQIKSKEDFTLLTHAISLLPQVREIRVSINHIPNIECVQTLLFYTSQLASLTIDLSNPSEKATHLFRKTFGTLPTITMSPISALRIIRSTTDATETPSIPDEFFSTLLPHLPNLIVLDFSTTTITSSALSTLPPSTRLTYLALSSCTHLAPSPLITFLTSHPATSALHTLILNNLTYTSKPLSEHDLSTLLSSLPPTLRSLDLSNSLMGPSHILSLQRFSLEELSVGSNLSLSDVEDLVLGGKYEYAPRTRASRLSGSLARDGATVLESTRAAVARCQFRQRQLSLQPRGRGTAQDGKNHLALRYLDLSSLPKSEQGQIRQSVLLAPETYPLAVLEVRGMPWDDYLELPGVCRSAGWREKWVGERVWVERRGEGEE